MAWLTIVGIEHVGLAQTEVARVVSDALIAAEGVRFGKSCSRTAGHVPECLVVAETAEGVILFGKRLVQADIEPGVIQLAHGLD